MQLKPSTYQTIVYNNTIITLPSHLTVSHIYPILPPPTPTYLEVQEGVGVQEVCGDLWPEDSGLVGRPEVSQSLPREDSHQQSGDTQHHCLPQGHRGLGQEV